MATASKRSTQPNDTANTATQSTHARVTARPSRAEYDGTSDEDWFSWQWRATPRCFGRLNGRSYSWGPCTPINHGRPELPFEIRKAGEVLSVTTPRAPEQSATGFILPTTGTYYVRVSGAGTDDSQLYDITAKGTTAADLAMAEVSITNTNGVSTAVAGRMDTLHVCTGRDTDGPMTYLVSFVADEFPAALHLFLHVGSQQGIRQHRLRQRYDSCRCYPSRASTGEVTLLDCCVDGQSFRTQQQRRPSANDP
jgi:hypothetical protein